MTAFMEQNVKTTTPVKFQDIFSDIVKKVTELLGAEDDVLVSYITNILEGEEPFPSGYKVRPRSSFENRARCTGTMIHPEPKYK